jgi:hypothetical protein
LRSLEQKYGAAIQVIGVHSGKYIAERNTDRIRDASIRLNAVHHIVNDRQFRIWRSYAVRAWPTLVIVDAAGYVVGAHAGEFTAEALEPLLNRLVGDADVAFDQTVVTADPPAHAQGTFLFPEKIAVDHRRIAVADTGNHRIIVAELNSDSTEARITRVIEGTTSGQLPIRSPQGMEFHNEFLFFTDSESHALNVADLSTGSVQTLAGTGEQIRTQADLRSGALSSPWDVVLTGDTLYVAMAGRHQIWSFDTARKALRVHAGTGGEDILDAPNREALLAQPMGITADGDQLYFADAESSAVRSCDATPSGAVRTLVGTGLFDFGDQNGAGDRVRLQHPQGVAYHAESRGLLVADSYNDALKWIDPATRESKTFVTGLHEPAGLACGSSHAFVADTNAHRVVAVDYGSGATHEVRFTGI